MNVCEKCGSPVYEHLEEERQYSDGAFYTVASWTVYVCSDQPDYENRNYNSDNYCMHRSYTCKEVPDENSIS